MVECNCCKGDYDVAIETSGYIFCSIECYKTAMTNYDLFKKAIKDNIALL